MDRFDYYAASRFLAKYAKNRPKKYVTLDGETMTAIIEGPDMAQCYPGLYIMTRRHRGH